MSKAQLVQIRTNSNFSVNYQDATLKPMIELILLFIEPKYEINKKSEITKGHELNEFRIMTDTDGISHIIGELQALQVKMLTFNNLSEGLNAIIKQSVQPAK